MTYKDRRFQGARLRPHFVERTRRYQLSASLTEAQADRLERIRIRLGHRSWSATIAALIDSEIHRWKAQKGQP